MKFKNSRSKSDGSRERNRLKIGSQMAKLSKTTRRRTKVSILSVFETSFRRRLWSQEFEIEKRRFQRKKPLENRITNGKVIEDDANTNESEHFKRLWDVFRRRLWSQEFEIEKRRFQRKKPLENRITNGKVIKDNANTNESEHFKRLWDVFRRRLWSQEFEIEKRRFQRKKPLENRITNGKVIEDDANTNESEHFKRLWDVFRRRLWSQEFEIEKRRFQRKKPLENRITNGKVIEDDANTNESEHFKRLWDIFCQRLWSSRIRDRKATVPEKETAWKSDHKWQSYRRRREHERKWAF